MHKKRENHKNNSLQYFNIFTPFKGVLKKLLLILNETSNNKIPKSTFKSELKLFVSQPLL